MPTQPATAVFYCLTCPRHQDSRLPLPRIEEIRRHTENPVRIFIPPRYIPPLFGEASDGIDPLRRTTQPLNAPGFSERLRTGCPARCRQQLRPIPISERLVQCIWYDQRLKLGALQTTDGRPVRIIFRGWWNLEAGPDFRQATVQIGDEAERTGDIELHLRAEDWKHHRYEHDAHFNDVILHVVLWEAGSQHVPRTRAGQIIPQVVIQHQLDTALEQLYDEIEM